MVKISSSYASTKPRFIILFLSNEALNGDEISISFIENVFAALFSVEKKIFNKARNKKRLYKLPNLINYKIREFHGTRRWLKEART